MGEHRLYIRERLERYDARTGEKTWQSFVETRERHKRHGATEQDAWASALLRFPVEKYPADEPVELPVGTIFAGDGSAAVRAGRASVEDTDSKGVPKSPSAGSAQSPLPEKTIDWESLTIQMNAEDGDFQESESKSVDYRASLDWVFQNISRPKVRPEHAPDAGAWSLLLQCRENEAFRKDFFRTVFTKLMPSQKEFESGNRFRDTGQELISFIERVVSAAKDAQYVGAELLN